eukprot:TRINITY_DN1645_c1_g2_i3.p1 TRINITY_DN1645_c1_g2~~TRINITY_DN1645_c1_g2_i3.p1  ORF type:complete len:616 (-),score=159.61 TRINITY_DN1645_c1_g2_i3:167-1960(-)
MQVDTFAVAPQLTQLPAPASTSAPASTGAAGHLAPVPPEAAEAGREKAREEAKRCAADLRSSIESRLTLSGLLRGQTPTPAELSAAQEPSASVNGTKQQVDQVASEPVQAQPQQEQQKLLQPRTKDPQQAKEPREDLEDPQHAKASSADVRAQALEASAERKQASASSAGGSSSASSRGEVERRQRLAREKLQQKYQASTPGSSSSSAAPPLSSASSSTAGAVEKAPQSRISKQALTRDPPEDLLKVRSATEWRSLKSTWTIPPPAETWTKMLSYGPDERPCQLRIFHANEEVFSLALVEPCLLFGSGLKSAHVADLTHDSVKAQHAALIFGRAGHFTVEPINGRVQISPVSANAAVLAALAREGRRAPSAEEDAVIDLQVGSGRSVLGPRSCCLRLAQSRLIFFLDVLPSGSGDDTATLRKRRRRSMSRSPLGAEGRIAPDDEEEQENAWRQAVQPPAPKSRRSRSRSRSRSRTRSRSRRRRTRSRSRSCGLRHSTANSKRSSDGSKRREAAAQRSARSRSRGRGRSRERTRGRSSSGSRSSASRGAKAAKQQQQRSAANAKGVDAGAKRKEKASGKEKDLERSKEKGKDRDRRTR